MKSQDIVILFKLVSLDQKEPYATYEMGLIEQTSVRGLEASLGISKSEVSASLKRSLNAGLAYRSNGQITASPRSLAEFVLHGLKYVFPAKPQAPQRGIATGFHAPMLEGKLVSSGADIYVWPDAEGNQRGPSIEPLFRSVPFATRQDENLYAYLALVDALRLGNQREANLAKQMIKERLCL